MTDPDMPSWLRRQIQARLYLAQHAIELGNNAEWVEQSSGVLVTSEPTETDVWHGTWPTGDSSLTRLMEANDPQDTIARCEAELGILDEHGELAGSIWCRTCDPGREDMDDSAAYFPCRTVRLLAAGYRHRPGWKEEWAS